MKKLLIIIFLLILIQKFYADWDNRPKYKKLNKKIKINIERQYLISIQEGKTNKKIRTTFIYKNSRDGKYPINKIYNTWRDEVATYSNVYNNEKKPLEFKGYRSKGNTNEIGQLFFRTVYKYNDKGYLTERISYGKKNIFRSRTVYKNDKEGKSIKSWDYDKEGNLTDTAIFQYEYDNKRRVIKSKTINDVNDANFINYFKYNAKGDIIESSLYDPRYKDYDKEIYLYNNQDYCYKQIRFYNSNPPKKYTYKSIMHFNEYGLMIGRETYKKKRKVDKDDWKLSEISEFQLEYWE